MCSQAATITYQQEIHICATIKIFLITSKIYYLFRRPYEKHIDRQKCRYIGLKDGLPQKLIKPDVAAGAGELNLDSDGAISVRRRRSARPVPGYRSLSA